MSLRIAVLSVGEELLAGDILDTNAHWLARELAARGHRLVSLATVGDHVPQIAAAVGRARRDADLLLVTGGLGPTADDLTRDGVAAALGLGLAERAEIIAGLEERWRAVGRPLTPGSRLQAVMPDGATVLANARGTAPGFLVREGVAGAGLASGDALAPWRPGEFAVACFPGVPSELYPMVRALLDAYSPRGVGQPARRLRLCGIPESEAGQLLGELMDPARAGCRVGITASLGVLTVSVRGEDRGAMDSAFVTARERLGEWIFSEGDATLAETVVGLLAERGLVVTTAESCTGGLVAGALTAVPGSSEVFREGAVTYANEVKVARLGVSDELLVEHGAVSEPVARAMAIGALQRSGADLALAVTGIAGPGGGTDGKPVGTVWFAATDARGTSVRHVSWKGGRDEIRARAVNLGLELLRRKILEVGS